MDEALRSRVEDAGLNASAPPQQRWIDGWLVRFSPGKAQRARCINAVASGRLPLKQRLQIALAVYAEAGLPALVRITPFTQPASLDDWLADQGWTRHDDTRVMVCPAIPRITPTPLPTGTQWERLDGAAYALAIGQLRGTPPGQIEAHAQRLAASPVPYQGFAIRRSSDGAVLACGQLAREAELVGLYDIHTQAGTRRQGFAITLCERLLALSTHEGATIAYLQVEAGNEPARRLYHRLGFADAYAYHYRQAP
ncbi:MAG: GNAT family N-acetyltransferase [Betaproteobacteria bacterium]|nr:GNAT family N-acetyltransferase [Betaproteobacteria bacterium]